MYSISNKLEYLSNFGVQESYKGKGSEGLRYKDISDLAKLGKIFTQIIRSHVFSTSTNKHFTWNLWIISFLQWTWYMISKQKIYIIHVIQLSSIYYYSMLPNCNSPILLLLLEKMKLIVDWKATSKQLFFQVKGASCLLWKNVSVRHFKKRWQNEVSILKNQISYLVLYKLPWN